MTSTDLAQEPCPLPATRGHGTDYLTARSAARPSRRPRAAAGRRIPLRRAKRRSPPASSASRFTSTTTRTGRPPISPISSPPTSSRRWSGCSTKIVDHPGDPTNVLPDGYRTVTAAEAARCLGITPNSVRERLRRGTLPGTRTGRTVGRLSVAGPRCALTGDDAVLGAPHHRAAGGVRGDGGTKRPGRPAVRAWLGSRR